MPQNNRYAGKLRRPYAAGAFVILCGCDGPQNWLSGAGLEAQRTEQLFWVLLVGAAVIWTLVMALAAYAATAKPSDPVRTEHRARTMVRWGGVVFPTVVLCALLVFSLFILRGTTDGEPGLIVDVEGEQWWWRVGYRTPDGQIVTTANELRLPQGVPVRFRLTSDDVIHSFWIPSIGGKMDMIPGRTNELTLTPIKTGSWEGICAEFCGGAHAQMKFRAIVVPPEEFAAWLQDLSRPAAVTSGDGIDAFLENGCGACHTIRGTPANGPVGPELTHFGSRSTIGAGILPMSEDALHRWIAQTHEVKPGVFMPDYPDLPEPERTRIVSYLMALE